MIRPLVDQADPKSFCKISTSPIFGAPSSWIGCWPISLICLLCYMQFNNWFIFPPAKESMHSSTRTKGYASYHYIVQSPVVNAEACCTIFLCYEYYWWRPWTLRWFYDPSLYLFFPMVVVWEDVLLDLYFLCCTVSVLPKSSWYLVKSSASFFFSGDRQISTVD